MAGAGMCLARLETRRPASQVSLSVAAWEGRLYYQEPWYGPRFDEVGDCWLSHVKSQVSGANDFLSPPRRRLSGQYFKAVVKDSDSVRWPTVHHVWQLCLSLALSLTRTHTYYKHSVPTFQPTCVFSCSSFTCNPRSCSDGGFPASCASAGDVSSPHRGLRYHTAAVTA